MDNASSPAGTLTIADLAEATATSTETVRAWRDLGLLSGPGDALRREDVERVRLLQFVQRRGIAPEAVARVRDPGGPARPGRRLASRPQTLRARGRGES